MAPEKKQAQLLAVLDKDTAERFKAQLAHDGFTYKGWLAKHIREYLNEGKKK